MKHTLLITICTIFCISTLHARPDSQKLESITSKLNTKIRMRYDKEPLMEVIEDLQDESEIPMIVDQVELQKRALTPITINIAEITVSNALNWVCDLAKIDYDYTKGAIFISSVDKILKPYVKMRAYDIRALTLEPQDFPGPDVSITSDDRGRSVAFESSEVPDSFTQSSLAEYIQYTISPDLWGSHNVSISSEAGFFFITTLEKHHKEISQLLASLADAKSMQVSMDLRVVRIATATLEELVPKIAQGINIISSEESKKLYAFLSKKENSKATVALQRMTGYNTQRIHAMCAVQETYIRDYTVEDAACDPEVGTFQHGFVFDVHPTVSLDKKSIAVVLRPGYAQLNKLQKATVPVPPIVVKNATIQTTATNESSDKDKKRQTSTTVETELQPDQIKMGKGSYDITLPTLDIFKTRTLTRIPNNGAAIISFNFPGDNSFGKSGEEMVLLVRPTVVQ